MDFRYSSEDQRVPQLELTESDDEDILGMKLRSIENSLEKGLTRYNLPIEPSADRSSESKVARIKNMFNSLSLFYRDSCKESESLTHLLINPTFRKVICGKTSGEYFSELECKELCSVLISMVRNSKPQISMKEEMAERIDKYGSLMIKYKEELKKL